jgi:eukaryotic-like serine/threonine-protein kinase
MSELWKRWEGQVIDHKYQLREFRGSTDHSAVFAAEYRTPEIRKTAVKFLAADLPHADQVLEDWKRAQKLNHEGLLTIFSVGRCRIEDMDLIYAAMEYADENLAEILPHRALTGDEAKETLAAVVEVLVFLHVNKLTHGHIKPSNILAVGNRLKLSSDTIEPISEPREMRRKRDSYDAPEIPAAAFTPAADVWSLGVTLVEALTQQPAFLPFNESAEPVLAPAIREPFREIASKALRRDPQARWTSLDIASKLNPQAAEELKAALAAAEAKSAPVATASTMPATASVSIAVAGASVATPAAPAASASAYAANPSVPQSASATPPVSPLAVPLSKEPPIPLGKQPTVKTVAARPPMPPPPVTRPEKKPSSAIVLPNYVVPLLAAVLIVVAFIALPKILRRETRLPAKPPSQSSAAVPAAAQNSAATPANSAPSEPAKTAPDTSANSSTTASATPPSSETDPTSGAPSSAVLRDSQANRAPHRVSGSPDKGEVLDQVIPRPGSAALASIDGTVRVVVRVHVDAAGNVSQARLENPGPSKYFAQKSLEAARGWVFLSPGVDGHSQDSEWLIRFDFTRSGANAYPKQVSP